MTTVHLTQSSEIEIVELPKNGLYYHDLGSMVIKSSTYDIILYKNLTIYHQEFDELTKLLYKFNQFNLKSKTNYISAMSLQAYLNQISNNLNQIENFYSKRLRKRGWFDFIGTGLHTLFGVMDSNDEDYYNDLIGQLEKRNKETLNLMKQNAHISKSVMQNLNATLSKFRGFESSITQNLNTLEKKTNQIITQENENKISALALQLHAQFIEYAIVLEEETNTILNAINFSQLGLLYSKILPVDIFDKEIKAIQIEDDKLLSDLFKVNIASLYKIIKPEIRIGKGLLIIQVHMPLVMNSVFNLFKIYSYPVPNKLNPQLSHLIQFHHPFVSFNEKNEYATIMDLKTCSQIENIWLCPHLEISTVTTQSPCEVLMKTSMKFPQQCEIQSIPLDVFNAVYLNFNEWLLLTTKEQRTFCKCDDHPTIKNTIKSSAIIRLLPGCTVFLGNDITLKAEVVETRNKTLENDLPLLQEDCCIQEINKIAYLNLDPVKIGPDHINNVELLNDELNNFQDNVEEEYNKPFQHLRTSWWKYTLGLTGLLFGTCCCCYLCCPKCLQMVNPMRPLVVINQTINNCRKTQEVREQTLPISSMMPLSRMQPIEDEGSIAANTRKKFVQFHR